MKCVKCLQIAFVKWAPDQDCTVHSHKKGYVNVRFLWSDEGSYVSLINHRVTIKAETLGHRCRSGTGKALQLKQDRQAITRHICRQVLSESFSYLHPYISLSRSLSTHSPSSLLMASGCLWLIYSTLTECVSVLLLCAVTKANVASLLAPFCGGYLEGTQQLGSTAASSSFSPRLLSVFFSLSDGSPSVLSCSGLHSTFNRSLK